MSIRVCDRCTATRKAGGRCTRRTCKVGPLCWQHTRLVSGLSVKPSSIPGAGNGLFAFRDFRPSSTVTRYSGEALTAAQVEARYPGNTLAPYVLKVGRDRFVDGRATNSGPARYVNDCRRADRDAGHCPGNNAKLSRTGTVKFASRPIPSGSEIFAPYGRQYWSGTSSRRKAPRRT